MSADKVETAEDDISSGNYAWLAVILVIFGSVVSNIGMNLQKQVHSMIAKELAENGKERNYAFDVRWITGMVCLIGGSLCDFAALGFGRQCVVAPLGSMSLVSNVLLSIPMHGERPTKPVVYATFAIMVGCAIAVAFGGEKSAPVDLHGVYDFYYRSEFWIYAITMSSSMFIFWMLLQFLNYSREAGGEFYSERHQYFHRFAYGALSGTMGAQNMLFAKSTSTLVIITFSGDEPGNLFFHLQSYLIIMALGFTIFMQLKWLNEGLKRFSALLIIPIFQAFWIFVSVIGGLYVFDELDQINGIAIFSFCLGVIITIGGVLFLSTQAPESASHGHGKATINESPHVSEIVEKDVMEASLLAQEVKPDMNALTFFHHVSEIADAITWGGPSSVGRLSIRGTGHSHMGYMGIHGRRPHTNPTDTTFKDILDLESSSDFSHNSNEILINAGPIEEDVMRSPYDVIVGRPPEITPAKENSDFSEPSDDGIQVIENL